MAKKYAHAGTGMNQRVCEWRESDGTWRLTQEVGGQGVKDDICRMDHPIKGTEYDDRGEFGMPGVGVWSLAPGRLMTVPEFNWEVKLTPKGMKVEFADGKGYEVPAVTEEAKEVMSIMQDVLKNFLLKNAQYDRAQSGHDLGIKGIMPDINRKSSALITRIWDADNQWDEQAQDSTEELAGDLIGHCLLLLAKIQIGMR